MPKSFLISDLLRNDSQRKHKRCADYGPYIYDDDSNKENIPPIINASAKRRKRTSLWSPAQDYEATISAQKTSALKRPPFTVKNNEECHHLTKRRKWSCGVCDKDFDRPSLLERHLRTHTGERPFKCTDCNKRFSTSSSLNTHLRIHTGERPHQCTVCQKRFTASSNLYYHRMTHAIEKPHKCSICPRTFATPGDLKSHIPQHTGDWPLYCPCGRGFVKTYGLRSHLLMHLGRKKHKCDECSMTFNLLVNLRTHKRDQHFDQQWRNIKSQSPVRLTNEELSVRVANKLGLCRDY